MPISFMMLQVRNTLRKCMKQFLVKSYRLDKSSTCIGMTRFDANTYTWTFKPLKTPQYIKLKMGGL